MRAADETSVAFDRARNAVDTALAQAGPELAVCEFLFGGERVRMRSAGHNLAHHLSRPFSHLSVANDPTATASLTIDVWDERKVHVPYPSESDINPADTSWPGGHGMLSVSPATRFLRYDCSSWVTWLDRAAGRIVAWRANSDRLSMHERTRPLPFLLPVWYADRGLHIIHAGLVARDDTGILFCGHNGAGKSTTSLACLCAGLDFLSDDHVGLVEHKGQYVGHSVFASTRLEPDHLERSFPELLPHAIKSDEWFESKSLVLVGEAMPERVRRWAPIKAIVLPVQVNQPSSRLQPVSRAEALRALAPSTLMQMPFGATATRFRELAQLTMTVPAYRLELGRNIAAIAPSVRDLMDKIS